MDFAIAGISIAVLIIGIVEAAKEFGINGKGSRALALVLGIFFVGLAQAAAQGLIPAVAIPWIELVVTALAGGLAAMGYYDFARRLRNGLTKPDLEQFRVYADPVTSGGPPAQPFIRADTGPSRDCDPPFSDARQ